MGQHWLRLLRQFNVNRAVEAIFRGAYPITLPPFPPAPTADAPQAAPYADKDWQLFTLSVRGKPGEVDARLFIPPAAPLLQESKPIERIVFTRDEMSNVVWAIESVVPDDRGGGIDGYKAALEVRRLLETIGAGTNPVPPAPPVETEAQILYRLATGVPENWIPFIPVRRNPPSPEVGCATPGCSA